MRNISVLLISSLSLSSCAPKKQNCTDYGHDDCATARPLSGKLCKVVASQCVDALEQIKTLEELELFTAHSFYGIQGKSIFVDITAQKSEQALEIMRSLQGKSPENCHVGVASFINFSLGAARKAGRIILLDYDPVVVKFNKIARTLLIESATAQEFKERLVELSIQDEHISARKFYPIMKSSSSNKDNLVDILNRKSSFLAQEDDFKYIKNLAKENKIHIVSGSIYDTYLISKIASLIGEKCAVDTVFLSNLYDWNSEQAKRDLLAQNIATLCRDDTKIVEVVPYPEGSHNVNIVYYKDPQSKELYNPLILRGKTSISRRAHYPAAPFLVD